MLNQRFENIEISKYKNHKVFDLSILLSLKNAKLSFRIRQKK